MNSTPDLPSFDEQLPFVDQFSLELVKSYQTGDLNSWDQLDEKVKNFFSPERMEQMEALVPGWKKMASCSEGITLTHVMCVFLGMYMTPQYLQLSPQKQQEMKWVVLFHDVEKEPQAGKRDHTHAFRSAVGAARTLPKLGFAVTPEYSARIDDWDKFTRSAITKVEDSPDNVQDNHKLPAILDGIGQMFGKNTPATLILKTILFHLSVNMDLWPPPNPLTNDEVKRYFNSEFADLLLIMNMGDNDGWALFDPVVRENQLADIIDKFEKIDKLLSS
jgi:hypothetical protein